MNGGITGELGADALKGSSLQEKTLHIAHYCLIHCNYKISIGVPSSKGYKY